MNSYVTGTIIKELRAKAHLTQAELADKIMVSNKAVSKWENGNGFPDITLLEPLARALNVSLIELMSGSAVSNNNRGGNMKRGKWYICPVCGNVVHTMGDTIVSCCGITLPPLEVEEENTGHEIRVARVESDYFISLDHPMGKDHYICFIAYVTDDKLCVERLYPEQNPESRFPVMGHGLVFAYCNHHGFFCKEV